MPRRIDAAKPLVVSRDTLQSHIKLAVGAVEVALDVLVDLEADDGADHAWTTRRM
ncbi:hypothetical protein D3C81_1914900 [compost metagenome]